MKNGEEIGQNPQYNTSRFYGNGSNVIWYNDLEIENIKRDDTANYSCFLRNEAGTDIDDVLLVVLGKFFILLPNEPIQKHIKLRLKQQTSKVRV